MAYRRIQVRSSFYRLLLIGCLVVAESLAVFAASQAAPPPHSTTLVIGGSEITVEFADGRRDLPTPVVLNHIERAACAAAAYYRHFPVRRYRILIVPIPGRSGVLAGTTWGYGGAHTRILLGEHTTEAQLKDDWTFTHEMVHTAFPNMPDENHWIEEGIATYVEPLARSWVGDYPPAKVWADLVSGLPNGLPGPGDQGLDHTHTWGRTYWGGAMFCTLADIEIRRRTANQRGLIDALRGILQASGGIEAEWSAERAFKTGDDAVGVPVMEELYDQMKAKPVSPDLRGLWKRLGIRSGSDTRFDESAPEAAIRRAIGARPSDAGNGCGPSDQPVPRGADGDVEGPRRNSKQNAGGSSER